MGFQTASRPSPPRQPREILGPARLDARNAERSGVAEANLVRIPEDFGQVFRFNSDTRSG